MAGEALFRICICKYTWNTKVRKWCLHDTVVLCWKEYFLNQSRKWLLLFWWSWVLENPSLNTTVCLDLGPSRPPCVELTELGSWLVHSVQLAQEHKKWNAGSGLDSVICQYHLFLCFLSSSDFNRLSGVSAVRKRAGFWLHVSYLVSGFL